MWPKPSTLCVCRCLLYKLTILNFPSYIVKTLSSYHHHRPFHTSFWLGSSTRRITRAGVAQGGLVSPVLFSLYVNDMPTPSRHVQLALSHSHVRRLEAYLNRFGLRLLGRITRLKGHSSTLAKTTACVRRPRPPQIFRSKPWGNP
jgi:hypothetical protein